MYSPKDKQLFLQLLSDTQMFGEQGRKVFEIGVKEETIPQADFDYLLFVLKLEKNMQFMVNEEANKKLRELQKKYKQPH